MKKLVLLFIASLPVVGLSQAPGNALNFDGSNDYVSTALPAVFTDIANNDFTVETWVKPNGSGTQRICFAQYDNNHFFSILLNSSNVPYVYVYNGGASGYNCGTALTTGTWNHISVSWDASASQVDIYINGALISPTGGGSSSTGSNNIMCIGSRSDGIQNLQGELDEFKIWDYYRPECDVIAGMNSEYDTPQTGLIAYYNFNEGTAGGTNTGLTTLPDFTTSYNGTLNNFGLTGTSSNWVASGADITAINQSGGSYATSYSQDLCLGDTIILGTQVLAMTGVFVETFSSVAGCDSVVTVDLTVHDTLGVPSTAYACDEYTWSANGMTYTVAGNYSAVLTSVYGCDSVVTLDLTINSVNVGASQSGNILTADASGATYQWLDCDNGFAPITGETNQSFTPTMNGNYAVQVMENGCTDTSACFNVNSLGIVEDSDLSTISIFPNPTSGMVTISFFDLNSDYSIIVRDVQGKEINRTELVNEPNYILTIEGESGVYFVEITSGEGREVFRVVKE